MYVTGYYFSNDFDAGGTSDLTNTCSCTGTTDVFFAKYDISSCTYQWAYNFGSSSSTATEDDYGNGLTVDASGNVYVTGQFYGTNTDFNPGTGTANLTSAGYNDIFMAKYNSSGTYQWAKRFGSTSYDAGNSITLDADKNIIITGSFSGTNVNFGLNTDDIYLTSAGLTDNFIGKYTEQVTHVTFPSYTSSSFNVNWIRPGLSGTNCIVFVSESSSGSPAPVNGTTYTANTTFKSGSQIGTTGWYCVYKGNGSSVTVNAPTEGKTYRVKVLEYATSGTIYNTIDATNNPANLSIPYSEPTTQASNLVFSQVRDTSFTVAWNNGNGSKRVVFVSQSGTGNPNPLDSNTYVANSKYTLGSNPYGDWYCVYNGTDNSVTVRGLTPLKSYKVQVYEYNGIAPIENYYTATSTNNPNIISTVNSAPSVQVSYLVADNNVKDTSFGYSWYYNGEMIVFACQGNSGNASPVDFTTYTANEKFSLGSQIGSSGWYCVYKGAAKNTLIRNLAPTTTYKLQAFSYNNGAGYEKYLSTISSDNTLVTTTDFPSPTIQASNISFTNKTDTSCTISWTNGNGTGRVVFMAKDGVSFTLLNDSTYPANSDYTIAANGYRGWVCVYNGNGNSFNVTGLTPNTQYYLRVCEYLGEPYRETFNVTGLNTLFTSKNTTIINFAETIDTTFISPDFNPGATTNSGDAIVYSSSDASVATIISNKIHIVNVGTCKIYATDNGNSTFASAKDSTVLTIKKSPLSIKAENASRNYGSSNIFSYIATGLKITDIISSVNLSTPATISSDIGDYNIIPSGAVLSSGSLNNYNVNYVQGVLTINPAPLSIIAENKSREYGEFNPSFSWQVSGIKNNDSIKSVELTSTAIPRSPIGIYDIIPSSAVFENGKASNYSITYVKGNLTIAESPIKICLVSVDMESGKSMVIWEKNNTAGLKGYNVYRQSSSVGVYDKIGTVPISKTGIFIDSTSAIERHSELYKITTIDANSVESRLDQCNYHKSLFLQYAGSVGGVNLTWQPYEIENSDVNFKSYIIYKGSDSTKLTVVDTVASNIYNFTDNDPLSLVYKYYYRIAGVKYDACYPDGHRKAGAGPFLESISNMEDNKLKATQELKYTHKYSFELVVSPNPVRDISTIRYLLPQTADVKAQIVNMLGKIVATISIGNQVEGNAQFYIDANKLNLSNGLYYLKVNAGKYEATTKISVVRYQ